MPDFWDSEVLLGKIGKNSREEIQVKKVSKKNREYIDIRVFWFDSSDNTYKPSSKGLAIPYESYGELKDILNSLG